MATSTKKTSYLLSLMVILIMLTLCSPAWSKIKQPLQPLMCYMGDTYILTLSLPGEAFNRAQNYLDEEINPTLEADGQAPLIALPQGVLMIIDRDNLRDREGELIGTGKEVVVNLFLVVRDLAAPPQFPPGHPYYPSGISVLLFKNFNNNQDVIFYLATNGLLPPDQTASEVSFAHYIERNEELKIKGETEVWGGDGAISLKTRFVAPEPYYEPAVTPELGRLVESPIWVRYASAPERIFVASLLRAVYEPAVADVRCNLDINVSDPIVGAIFNSLDETNLTRFRFTRQIQLIEEIP